MKFLTTLFRCKSDRRQMSRNMAMEKIEEARQTAERGGYRRRQLFPHWTVTVEAGGGKPEARSKSFTPSIIWKIS